MNDIQHLGSIDGTEIAVRADGLRQMILVQAGDTGRHLVQFLGFEPGELDTLALDGRHYWNVPHDGQVDQRLKQVIDVLISIRYLHPTFVQLQMELT